MNSFDEIQVDEIASDDAYAEWLWRHELSVRESLDNESEADMIEEINRLFDEAAAS